MTVRRAPLPTLLFGLVELCFKKLGLILLSGISPGFLTLLHFGQEGGKAGRAASPPLTMLQGGLTLSACWFNFVLFWELCIGPPLLMI